MEREEPGSGERDIEPGSGDGTLVHQKNVAKDSLSKKSLLDPKEPAAWD